MTKHVDLTQGKVSSSLLKLSIPVIATSFLQLSYNFLDMIWVGRLGSEAVASIGVSSFLIGVINALQMTVVIGTGIMVSHALGQRDTEKQHRNLNAGFRLNILFSLLLAGSILVIGQPFITFMNVGNETVERLAYQYLLSYAPALFFSFMNLWYVRVYNSYGLNKKAFRISAIGFMINIFLDPLLIYRYGFGVIGAGLATLIANIIMSGMFLIDGKNLFTLDLRMTIPKATYYKILQLGFPNAIQRILFSLVNIMIGTMIASFGAEAVAAQKIGLQIESFTFIVIGGLNSAVISFVGQNYGSKKYGRIKEGVQVALRMGSIYALVTTAIFLFFPEYLARIFVSDSPTIAIAVDYLRIIGLTQLFMSIEIIFNGAFIGVGLPKIPAIISIVYTVLRIPLAWIFIQWFGINGVWYSISLSMLFRGSTAAIVYHRKKKSL